MKLIIISGRSGSGKSVCLHMLEDAGFYCVDNLPIGLLLALTQEIQSHPSGIAVSIDARNLPTEFNRFSNIIDSLKKTTTHCEIIFFDAHDDILLKRFSETRRRHPLSSDKTSLQEALQQEKHLLEPIAKMANLRIDSSQLTVQQLRALVRDRIITHKTNATGLSILFESFGYKFGVPTDADYVFDLRCIANPYWEPKLRECNGLDPAVAAFLQKQPQTTQLLQDIQHFLQTWLPAFAMDNRNYMTIAFGCTGGQHRSVYFAEQLANHFRSLYPNLQVRHREL